MALFKKFFLFLFLLLFTGCGFDSDYRNTGMHKVFTVNEGVFKTPAGKKALKTITFSAEDGISSFNPYNCSSYADNFISSAVYSTLFNKDFESQMPEKNLIADYKVSQDLLVYTFVLKSNVRFNNGEFFTSDDVEASLKLLGGTLACLPVHAKFFINNEKLDFKKISNLDFEIILDRPNGNLINALCGYPVLYRKQIDFYLKSPDFDGKNFYIEDLKSIIGSGPYRIKAVSDEMIIFERNKFYFKKDPKDNPYPYTDMMQIKFFKDINEGITDFTFHETDMISLDENDFMNLYNYYRYDILNKIRFIKTGGRDDLFAVFNASDERRFKEKSSRLIFSEMLMMLFEDYNTMPDPDKRKNAVSANAGRIRKYIKNNKLKAGNLTFLLCEQNENIVNMAEHFKDALEDCGIYLNLKIEPYHSFAEKLKNDNHYDAALFYYDYRKDIKGFEDILKRSGIYALLNEKNNSPMLVRLNDMLNAAIDENDLSAQKIKLEAIDGFLKEERVFFNIYEDNDYFAVNGSLHNLKINGGCGSIISRRSFETMFKY